MTILWLWFIFVFFMCCPAWINARKLLRWKKDHHLIYHEQSFIEITSGYNGFILSQQARGVTCALEDVYGEINFLSFVGLMQHVTIRPDTVFYDLGSGTGKAVFVCAMVFDLKKSCGIEHFDVLHDAALKQQEHLARLPLYQIKKCNIHFICADFLTQDLSDATLIFINSTAFFGLYWLDICKKLDDIMMCETIITTSKPMVSSVYFVAKKARVNMSWGEVFAYIHVRATDIKKNEITY